MAFPLFLALSVALAAPSTAQASAPQGAAAKPAENPKPFDPSRDALKDFEAAKLEARKTGKRILVDVGGNWCVWCRRLDAFFEGNPALVAQRDKGFVLLKVNFSPENPNKALLSRFPKVQGYPHFFVLDADGTLLHSQDTGVLETGPGYDAKKISDFLGAWTAAPGR